MLNWLSEYITQKHLMLFLVLLTLAVYLPFANNEFVSLDDPILITQNLAVREISPWSFKHIFTTFDPELYIPVTFLSYQLTYALFGLQPWAYHVGNILLHAGSAALVFLIIERLSKNRWLALFCAALFAIHPINTEAVLWAAARKDVLSSFFFLGSVLMYLRYRESEKNSPFSILNSQFLFGLLLFLLALLSKVSVFTFPLLLLAIAWYQERRISKKTLAEIAPFAVLSVVFFAVALYGKRLQLGDSDPVTTVFLGLKGAVFYIQKIFLPTNLSLIYHQATDATLQSMEFLLPILIVLLLILFGALQILDFKFPSYFKFQFSNFPARSIAFGLAWFFIFLIPNSTNFFKGGFLTFASDRYAYLPSIGIFFIAGTLVEYFITKKQLLMPLTAILILAFTPLTILQARTWRTTEAMYENVIASYPTLAMAYNNLADALIQRGEIEEAYVYLEKAITYDVELTPAHALLGNYYRARGEYDKAIAEYDLAIESVEKMEEIPSGDFLVGYYLRGEVLEVLGKDLEAVQSFEEAVETGDQFAEAHYNLGVMYHKHRLFLDAKMQYTRAIELDDRTIDAHYNLAAILGEMGELDLAMAELERVVELDPNHVKAKEHLENLKGMID